LDREFHSHVNWNSNRKFKSKTF